MREEFLRQLGQITLLALTGRLVLHFLPEGGYEKYVHIIISVMILARAAVPLFAMREGDFSSALDGYLREMERITVEVEQTEFAEWDYQAQGLEQAVREKLDGREAALGLEIVSVQADAAGMLLLTVRESGSGSAGPQEGIRIDPISLPAEAEGRENGEGREEGNREDRKEKEKILAQYLETEASKLEVKWIE